MNLYASSVQHNGIFDDGQSKSGATELPTPAFVYAIESFEQSGQVLIRYTYAIISEGKPPFLLIFFSVKGDGCPVASVRNGIVSQVSEYAVQQTLIALNDDVFGKLLTKAM